MEKCDKKILKEIQIASNLLKERSYNLVTGYEYEDNFYVDLGNIFEKASKEIQDFLEREDFS